MNMTRVWRLAAQGIKRISNHLLEGGQDVKKGAASSLSISIHRVFVKLSLKSARKAWIVDVVFDVSISQVYRNFGLPYA